MHYLLHFFFLGYDGFEEGYLISGSNEVVFRVGCFIVGVVVEVVGKEAEGLDEDYFFGSEE